jgi:hypothetical protein
MLSCTAMPFGARITSRAALVLRGGLLASVSIRSVSIPGAMLLGTILVGSILLGCGAPSAAADPGFEASAGGDGAAEPGGPAPTGNGAPATSSDPDPPAAGVYRGTYFVPVPPELEPYALFELESVRVEARGDELGLQYDLPELLLGEPRGLSFRGGATADGEYRLEGDDGVATCRPSAGRWRCDEALNGIELDASKIERLLEALPDAEARGRRGVADRFSVDPIGVLELGLSPLP